MKTKKNKNLKNQKNTGHHKSFRNKSNEPKDVHLKSNSKNKFIVIGVSAVLLIFLIWIITLFLPNSSKTRTSRNTQNIENNSMANSNQSDLNGIIENSNENQQNNAIANSEPNSNNNSTGVKLNPPHGEPGHRCDIAVGAPLNSAPAKVNPNPVITQQVNNTPNPVIENPTTPEITPVAEQENTSATEITFAKTVHDYGIIAVDSDGSCKFTFENTGSEPLILKDVKSSCGCTVPSWPKEPILPGKSASIDVIYDTKKAGTFNKTVTVTSNAKNSPFVLTIKGEVKE